MRQARKPGFQNETTIKITAPPSGLARVSKLTNLLKESLNGAVKNDSGIKQSVESGDYFVYLNLDSEKLDVILEKVTLLTGGVQF
jgi:hypothetical protein